MNREDVIRQIVDRDLRNEGLASESVEKDVPELYAAACEQFGTWDTALQYAGISVRRVITEVELSPERVIKRIRKMCTNGYDMSSQRNVRRDRRFYDAARLHFGSWNKAMQAAGINVKNLRPSKKTRKHDKKRIVEAIREWHAAGHSIKCCDVSLENRALATVAISAFYSWQRALVAAGLAPSDSLSDVGKRWSKDIIIAEIRARHEAGKPCNYMGTRPDQSGLVSAARRYFGNWTNALEAAGVPAKSSENEGKAASR